MSTAFYPCNGCGGRGLVAYDEEDLRSRAERAAEEIGRMIYWRTTIPHGDHYHRVLLLAGYDLNSGFLDDLPSPFGPFVVNEIYGVG